jgi:hypothetical protein
MHTKFIFGLFIISLLLISGCDEKKGEGDKSYPDESTLQQFVGANFLLLNFPVIITVIGFLGAILMFSQIGKGQDGGVI